MSTVRLRRLHADFLKLQDYVRRHPRVQLVQHDGDPPERYQLRYSIKSLRQKDDDLLQVSDHLVEIALPLNYPRTPPQCRMLTPIFHPNIAPHAVCIGDHWSAGESLASIVARIGEMIAYQSYNTKSPLNGEAARWVSEHLDELPLDPVSLMPDDAGADVGAAAGVPARPSGASVAPVPPAVPGFSPPPLPAMAPAPPPPEGERRFACPHCGSIARWTPEIAGRQLRCPRCRTVFRAPQ